MMGYWYEGGGGWMWVFSGLMMIGVLVLIGAAVWALISVGLRGNRQERGPETGRPDADGRIRTKQILDERYARGVMTTDEYTERLQTLSR